MHLMAFLTALQFLTIFPVTLKRASSEQEVGLSLLYYPVIGLLLGTVLVLLALFLSTLTVFNDSAYGGLVSAALLLIVWVLLSGAIHLDGFADSADAFMAGHSVLDGRVIDDDKIIDRRKDKILEVMKDPRSGPIAIVALIALLLFKFSLIAVVIEQQWFSLLLLAPVFGRLILPILLLSTPYVRKNGLGNWLVEYAPRDLIKPALVVFLLLLVVCSGFWLIPVAGICALVLFYLRKILLSVLGGTTGDTAGALVEMMEVVFLFLAIIFVKM